VGLHAVRAGLLAALLLIGAPLAAQAPAPASKGATRTAPTRPTWNELSPAQREALKPLAGMWSTLEPERKQKWLEVAQRYPNLSADGKQRVHERMAEYAKLTPEQRITARENFRRAYELPADQRQEKFQLYQELSEDKKRELAERAAKKQDAARRPPPAKGEQKAK
jgi:hypothetical protein